MCQRRINKALDRMRRRTKAKQIIKSRRRTLAPSCFALTVKHSWRLTCSEPTLGAPVIAPNSSNTDSDIPKSGSTVFPVFVFAFAFVGTLINVATFTSPLLLYPRHHHIRTFSRHPPNGLVNRLLSSSLSSRLAVSSFPALPSAQSVLRSLKHRCAPGQDDDFAADYGSDEDLAALGPRYMSSLAKLVSEEEEEGFIRY
jgi:hypothetical protein